MGFQWMVAAWLNTDLSAGLKPPIHDLKGSFSLVARKIWMHGCYFPWMINLATLPVHQHYVWLGNPVGAYFLVTL